MWWPTWEGTHRFRGHKEVWRRKQVHKLLVGDARCVLSLGWVSVPVGFSHPAGSTETHQTTLTHSCFEFTPKKNSLQIFSAKYRCLNHERLLHKRQNLINIFFGHIHVRPIEKLGFKLHLYCSVTVQAIINYRVSFVWKMLMLNQQSTSWGVKELVVATVGSYVMEWDTLVLVL